MPQIVTVSAPSLRRGVHADGSYAERPGRPIHDVPGHDAQGVMMPQAAQDTAGRVDIGSDKVVTPLGGNLLQCFLTGCAAFCTGRRYREKGPGTGNYRGHEADE